MAVCAVGYAQASSCRLAVCTRLRPPPLSRCSRFFSLPPFDLRSTQTVRSTRTCSLRLSAQPWSSHRLFALLQPLRAAALFGEDGYPPRSVSMACHRNDRRRSCRRLGASTSANSRAATTSRMILTACICLVLAMAVVVSPTDARAVPDPDPEPDVGEGEARLAGRKLGARQLATSADAE